MLLRYFYDEKLAQASYLVGCQATGDAIVIDPHRNIEPYLESARAEGMKITAVAETHIHADLVSGTRELAARSGATAYLSDEGGADWRYEYADTLPSVLLKDGDIWNIGNIKFEARHTPGHTPEHMSFILTDTEAADAPMGVFTGDFIFVGDVGRPDLLETVVGEVGASDIAARMLFDSLQRFQPLPDYLQLWPGHGSGSACGKAIGAVPSSTLGYEKLFNPAFQAQTEDEFVRTILEGQTDPPRYFAQMKRVNREGPALLGGLPQLARLPVEKLIEVAASDTDVVIDTRRFSSFAAAHVPGTIGIVLGRSFTSYAGRVLPYDRPIYLIVPEENCEEAVRALTSIGLDNLAGYFLPHGVDEWKDQSGSGLRAIRQLKPSAAAPLVEASEFNILDVRRGDEYHAGHVPHAIHIPLDDLEQRMSEVPDDKRLLIVCQSGGRSMVGAAILKNRGFNSEVINLQGGTGGWIKAGLPTE